MSAEAFLCLAGTELGNHVRTSTYLARGLGGPRWSIGGITRLIPAIGDDFYSDVYSDVYDGAIGYTYSRESSCPCSALGLPTDYTSPDEDPAPWWMASRPGSGGFLGVVLDQVDLLPVLTRSVSPRAEFGAVLGRLRQRQRVVQVSGLMVAADKAGMTWGERWLAEALRGSLCEPLRGDEATVLPACPAEGSSQASIDAAFRQLRQVGVVDGPTFTREADLPPAIAQRVAFQLVAANPFLHAPTEVVMDSQLVAGGAYGAIEVETDEWLGDAALTVTLQAVTDSTGIVVSGTPMVEGQLCPQVGILPCLAYTIPSLSGGVTLTIDAVDRLITAVDETSNREVSGFGLLDVAAGPFGWLEVPPCSRMCVQVTVETGGVVATISRTDREV